MTREDGKCDASAIAGGRVGRREGGGEWGGNARGRDDKNPLYTSNRDG